jgi:hypothetical protein
MFVQYKLETSYAIFGKGERGWRVLQTNQAFVSSLSVMLAGCACGTPASLRRRHRARRRLGVYRGAAL